MKGRDASEFFESEVRRVARLIFSDMQGFSGEIHEGRERDAYFDDGETVHIIEVTRNAAKAKAEKDLDKSVELKKALQLEHPDKNYKIWFVTEKEPTADQAGLRDIYRKKARCPVVVLSFRTFEQKLVDAPQYLASRNDYKFGSVKNLVGRDQFLPLPEEIYIPLKLSSKGALESYSTSDLADVMVDDSATAFLLLGPYGSGKSMTLRELFFELKRRYDSREETKFPLHLNLRDHIGQDHPSSAIYDHAYRIGFYQPEKLVRAWRAGQVHVILDGFDEISSSRFRGDVEGMRRVRKNAMTLVRKFVQEHPLDMAGLVVSGRHNYFGSEGECLDALGLADRPNKVLSISEFDEDQIRSYLSKVGVDTEFIPDWMPSRPLLVGYLANRQILLDSLKTLANVDAAEGWDYLLDKIADREGEQLEELGGSKEDLRLYIERLASRARCTVDGRGPLALKEMVDVLKEILPTVPDEAAQQLLLRMAGLTSTSTDDDDSREFVDDDFVDAARAGDVARFVIDNYDKSLVSLFSDRDLMAAGGDICKSLVERKLSNLPPGKLVSSFQNACDNVDSPALASDIYGVLLRCGISVKDYSPSGGKYLIRDGYLSEVEVDLDLDFSPVVFSQCLIQNLDVGGRDFSGAPAFDRCHIEQVSAGGLDIANIEMLIGEGSDFISVKEDTDTSSGLRKLDIPDGVKVLLTVLRKLFIQAGKGRKESAFFRGLETKEKAYVSDVLKLISKHGFAVRSTSGNRDVWVPNRAMKEESMSILGAPEQSDSPLVVEAREL